MPTLKKQISEPEVAFKAADETKKIEPVESDANKTSASGSAMDPK